MPLARRHELFSQGNENRLFCDAVVQRRVRFAIELWVRASAFFGGAVTALKETRREDSKATGAEGALQAHRIPHGCACRSQEAGW